MVLPLGIGTRESACSIASINLALSGRLTDDIPYCMSDVIGKWIIHIQDEMPHAMRNSEAWKRLLPLAAGTGKDRKLEHLRLEMIKKWAVVSISEITKKSQRHVENDYTLRIGSSEHIACLVVDAIKLCSVRSVKESQSRHWKSVNPTKLLSRLIKIGQPKKRISARNNKNKQHQQTKKGPHKMSHRLVGTVCLTDTNSLRKAVMKNPKLQWVEGATEYKYNYNHRKCIHKIKLDGIKDGDYYELGVVESEDGKGYRLEWESDAIKISAIIGDQGENLHTDYAREVSRDWAAKNGFTLVENTDAQGQIVLTMTN